MLNHNLKNQQTDTNDKTEEKWYNLSSEEIESKLNSNLETGLDDQEIISKQEKYGFNEITSKKEEKYIYKISRTI